MLLNIDHNRQDKSLLASSIVNEEVNREASPGSLPRVCLAALTGQLLVGDVVFIRVSVLPFRKVAQTTLSWTNHVGIVVETSDNGSTIAESTFPISKITSLSRFVARSAQGRVAVRRLPNPLSIDEQSSIHLAAQRRLRTFYDTGFNLYSRRQFCSRFVREILMEATGREVGKVEQFSDFLTQNPDVDLMFWRLWYFGKIPWERQTITPASLLNSSALQTVFNGFVGQKKKFTNLRYSYR